MQPENNHTLEISHGSQIPLVIILATSLFVLPPLSTIRGLFLLTMTNTFEKQRDYLVQEIASAMDSVVNNLDTLNRSLNESIQVGKEFENVGRLWSSFYDGELKSQERQVAQGAEVLEEREKVQEGQEGEDQEVQVDQEGQDDEEGLGQPEKISTP